MCDAGVDIFRASARASDSFDGSIHAPLCCACSTLDVSHINVALRVASAGFSQQFNAFVVFVYCFLMFSACRRTRVFYSLVRIMCCRDVCSLIMMCFKETKCCTLRALRFVNSTFVFLCEVRKRESHIFWFCFASVESIDFRYISFCVVLLFVDFKAGCFLLLFKMC